MAHDYYNILGVNREATAEDIKKAFRKLAHQHHPDKGGGDAEKFKEINEAYQVLSNPEKRSQYDRFGATFEQARSGGGTAGGPFGGFRTEDVNFDFGDLGDIFGDIFGMGSRGRGRTGKRGGASIEADINLTFTEAAFGTEKVINLRKAVACQTCGGSGAAAGSSLETCSTCGGSGQIAQVRQTILGSFQSVGVCPTCSGEGQKPGRKCPACRGDGRTRELVALNVKVPAGIDDGERIRLEGQGEVGPHGAPAGDLFLTVRIEPHPLFQREGYDVRSEVDVSISQAALGAKIPVETIDGPVVLKVPPGTQSGKSFKLNGKGMPRLRSRGRGDHLVTVIVRTPQRLSGRAKRLLEEFAEEQGEAF